MTEAINKAKMSKIDEIISKYKLEKNEQAVIKEHLRLKKKKLKKSIKK